MSEPEVFTLTIRLENDAFQEGHRNREVARILRELSGYLERYEGFEGSLSLSDNNGNGVGWAAFRQGR